MSINNMNSLCEESMVHIFHELVDSIDSRCHGNSLLVNQVPRLSDDLSALEVTGSNLHSDGDTLPIKPIN